MKILVATGKSGGHVFPALAFIDALCEKYKDIEALLILPKRSIIIPVKNSKFKVRYICVSSFRAGLDFKNIIGVFNILRCSLESLFILLDFRPDVVVAFGSLSCIPIVILAWLFRINILIHEQNVIPGRANMFLARFSDRIAISFKASEGYFGRYRNKVVFTGNPIRPELTRIDKKTALEFFGLKESKFTILIMGGSQGSHKINMAVIDAVSKLSNKATLQFIHITGVYDYEKLANRYKELDIDVKLFDFLYPMQYAYSVADLAICRCGATTIAELISFALPAIIIPYPYAYGHQMANAKVLEEKGAALVIRDEELDSGVLKKNIEYFRDNPQCMAKMRLAYGSFFESNAKDALVKEAVVLFH